MATERLPGDQYLTPQSLADTVVSRLWDLGLRPNRVLEPSCGHGAFIHSARKAWPGSFILGEDIDPVSREISLEAGANVTAEPGNVYDGFDVVLGNPPFSLASEQIRGALARTRSGGHVVMLLRLSYLEPISNRGDLTGSWQFAIPVKGRAKFRPDKKGSDNVGLVVLAWCKGYSGNGTWISPPIEWR